MSIPIKSDESDMDVEVAVDIAMVIVPVDDVAIVIVDVMMWIFQWYLAVSLALGGLIGGVDVNSIAEVSSDTGCLSKLVKGDPAVDFVVMWLVETPSKFFNIKDVVMLSKYS
jgi:hypothetical protein